jgi:sortase A
MLLGASYFLFAAGITAVSYAAYVVVDAHAYQAKEQSKFENVSVSPKETPVPLAEGGVIGEILVPRLELKAIVVQGYSEKLLRRGVGHMPGTALPGEPGNVALAGHRDTFFRPLRSIKKGDAITLKTENGDFQYQVESTEVVTANEVDVLKATQGRTLTLITCFPFTYVGPAPKRYVVHAREVEPPRELIGR